MAEAELTGGVATDVEGIGRFPFVFVAVGGRVDDQYACAGCDRDAGDVGVVARLAREGAAGIRI